MTKSTIHGHEVGTLTSLIRDAWPNFADGYQLCPLGVGWSHVNLSIQSDSPVYVVKLPGLNTHYEENPYDYTWNMNSQISEHGLCPRPVFKGRLDDNNSTPFVILEFIKGKVVENLGDLSDDEAIQIGKTLSLFSDLRPSGVRSFSNVLDFVETLLIRPSNLVVDLPPSTRRVRTQWNQLKTSVDKFIETYNVSSSWSPGLMHGDLQESNIVLSEGAKLLDLESCAYGDSRFDMVYLQTQHASMMDSPPRSTLKDEHLPRED
ncbi:MAG: aminoglycoside phosphotransferase family protein, partial [Candidatus Thorarchaeota archaeon]